MELSSRIETTSESRLCRSMNPGKALPFQFLAIFSPTDHLLFLGVFSEHKDERDKGARVDALLPPAILF